MVAGRAGAFSVNMFCISRIDMLLEILTYRGMSGANIGPYMMQIKSPADKLGKYLDVMRRALSNIDTDFPVVDFPAQR